MIIGTNLLLSIFYSINQAVYIVFQKHVMHFQQ